MVNYVYKRNKDGIHYLDLAKTWEKLMVAARVIAATQAKNLKDVLVSNSIKNKKSQYFYLYFDYFKSSTFWRARLVIRIIKKDT